MALTNDQKIEILKIIIGAAFSLVCALWTYTTYTENERNSELKALISLGDSISGMQVSCKGDFGQLADLADKVKGSREKRCYEYFVDAHRKSLSAMIVVRKPVLTPLVEWEGYWNTLQNEISLMGSTNYSFGGIEHAWISILSKKGLKKGIEDKEK